MYILLRETCLATGLWPIVVFRRTMYQSAHKVNLRVQWTWKALSRASFLPSHNAWFEGCNVGVVKVDDGESPYAQQKHHVTGMTSSV